MPSPNFSPSFNSKGTGRLGVGLKVNVKAVKDEAVGKPEPVAATPRKGISYRGR